MIIAVHVYQWRSARLFASCSPSNSGTIITIAAKAVPPKANSIINVIMVVRHPLITFTPFLFNNKVYQPAKHPAGYQKGDSSNDQAQ